MEQKRDFGLDLLRATAAVLVIAEHFFLNSSYYQLPLSGETMAVCTFFRMLFMSCTPMFMMLSGYLCIKKTWKPGYLRGLLSVYAVWLAASVVCLVFRKFWLQEPLGISASLDEILLFSAVPYGWYVEMYLGLYLLFPLLNAAWYGLNRTARRNTLIALFALTLIPNAVNDFRTLLPDWWVSLYPITYYYLGAWLHENPLRVKNVWLVLGWLGFAALSASIRWIRADGMAFTWTSYVDRSSAFVAAQSVCLFCLLSRCSGEKWPGAGKKIIAFLAKHSLPFYLASYLSDSILYPTFCRLLPVMKQQLLCFPLILLADVLLTSPLAWAIDRAAGAIVSFVPRRKQSEINC